MEQETLIKIFNSTRQFITRLHHYIKEHNIEIPTDKKEYYDQLIDFWFSISIRNNIKEFLILKELHIQLVGFFLTNEELKIIWLDYVKINRRLMGYLNVAITAESMDPSSAKNYSIKKLSQKTELSAKKLRYRTYKTETGLRINPRDYLRDEDDFYGVRLFEYSSEDNKIQLQYYLDEDLVGFVLLVKFPVDIYHPEIYTEEERITYSGIFTLIKHSETLTVSNSHIPIFHGDKYHLAYIHIMDGFRLQGCGTKVIRSVMKHYNFITFVEGFIAEKAFTFAGCINYSDSSRGKVFRSK